MKKILLPILILLQVYCVYSQHNSRDFDFNQSRLQHPISLDTIPFRFVDNHIIIEATIAGKKGNFIIDTGAPTLLFKSFHNSLNLPTIGSIRVRAAHHQAEQQDYLIVPTVTIQNIHFANVPVLVMDMKQTGLNNSSVKIDGLIGSNQLKDLVLKIDLNNKILIASTNAKKLGLLKKDGLKIKLDPNKRPFIQVNVSGKKTLVLVDTGFNGLYAMPIDFFHFHKKYFMAHALKKGGTTSTYTSIYGKTTTENLPLIRCPYLKIGQLNLEKVVTLPYPGQEGLLGTELLEEGSITIDYIEKRFYFSK